MSAFKRIWTTCSGAPLLACVAIAFEPACAARLYADPVQVSAATSDDDGVVYVDAAPVNIETYPHYAYDGGYAYYVDGRWYHQGPRGWGYYRQEPPALQRQRGYVQQAAAAPRDRPSAQQAAPERREAPGVTNAQPRAEEARRAPAAKRAAPADKRAESHEEHGR
jgi:hypothetical protein